MRYRNNRKQRPLARMTPLQIWKNRLRAVLAEYARGFQQADQSPRESMPNNTAVMRSGSRVG
jgi:hypothetical protein